MPSPLSCLSTAFSIVKEIVLVSLAFQREDAATHTHKYFCLYQEIEEENLVYLDSDQFRRVQGKESSSFVWTITFHIETLLGLLDECLDLGANDVVFLQKGRFLGPFVNELVFVNLCLAMVVFSKF